MNSNSKCNRGFDDSLAFGIKTAEQVAQTAEFDDAVVVGSAVIERIAGGLANKVGSEEIVASVHRVVGELAGGLRNLS